ncbi:MULTISPECIES: GNAT family N-acetyltransferase [Clavibacter]|nr:MULTISPECIES: GNAT family N-acetyltransferase [Clavibacter]MDA3803789.1 GNAT family N-acetyltransferase [Clavibacter sp. CT19]
MTADDPLPDRPGDEARAVPGADEIAIRAAEPADMRAVAELRWRWSVDESGTAPVTDPAGYVAATTAFADAHAGTHRCVVAERDGVVVGLAWLALTDRPPTPDDLSRVAGDVQSVYVVPELRGSGTGSRLVAALLDDARAAGCRYVRVHSSPRAIAVYARAGFAVDETYRVVRL